MRKAYRNALEVETKNIIRVPEDQFEELKKAKKIKDYTPPNKMIGKAPKKKAAKKKAVKKSSKKKS